MFLTLVGIVVCTNEHFAERETEGRHMKKTAWPSHEKRNELTKISFVYGRSILVGSVLRFLTTHLLYLAVAVPKLIHYNVLFKQICSRTYMHFFTSSPQAKR